MADKKTGSFLSGVAIGAAIGVVSGVMLNPRTTRRVRRALLNTRDLLQESIQRLPQQLPQQLPTYTQRLRDTTQAWSSVVVGQVSDLAEDLQDDWQGTAQRLKEAAIAGWEASRQEYLAAIHASEASDSQASEHDAVDRDAFNHATEFDDRDHGDSQDDRTTATGATFPPHSPKHSPGSSGSSSVCE